LEYGWPIGVVELSGPSTEYTVLVRILRNWKSPASKRIIGREELLWNPRVRPSGVIVDGAVCAAAIAVCVANLVVTIRQRKRLKLQFSLKTPFQLVLAAAVGLALLKLPFQSPQSSVFRWWLYDRIPFGISVVTTAMLVCWSVELTVMGLRKFFSMSQTP